jgi:FKBP-type peptidyl-prolyl cis-trans isomerase
MRKFKMMRPGILGILSVFIISGCIKDDSKELKEQEMRLLQQYIADNNITADPTASGLYYVPISEGTGISPDDGTWVEIAYIGELIDGTVFSTSMEQTADQYGILDEGFMYGPTRLQVGNIGVEGLNEGIQLMKVGGKAKFIIPSDLGFGGFATGMVPAYSTLIYTIDLLVAFDDPPQHEQELIWDYLKAGAYEDVDSTESGIYYIRKTAGSGELYMDGDEVDIWYTGTFLDGRVFESNRDGTVFTYQLPASNVIEGWRQGIKLMRDGEEGILIIPYNLAYGPEGKYDQYGRVVVPPYMTLVFDMETSLSE